MSFWEDKRIIVTGGAGFLGSYVIEKLKDRGYKDIFIPLIDNYDLTIEYIIIDDNLTDNSVQILQAYAKKDLRIKLYFNPLNLGVNKSFEKGITVSSGNYIFLCDQDDLWDKIKVEKMVHKIECGYDLVYCDLRVINSNCRLMAKSFQKLICTNHLQSKNLTRYLLFRNIINGYSACFKKEID